MTSSGRRIAFLIAVAIAFLLPKRVEDTHGRCTHYQIEPWGCYLLGQLAGREVGFAYQSGTDCR